MARVKTFDKDIEENMRKNAIDHAEKMAHRARAYAAGVVPDDTGNYDRSFRVVVGRWAVMVINNDPGALAIELGARGGKNPRFRALGRALEAIKEG